MLDELELYPITRMRLPRGSATVGAGHQVGIEHVARSAYEFEGTAHAELKEGAEGRFERGAPEEGMPEFLQFQPQAQDDTDKWIDVHHSRARCRLEVAVRVPCSWKLARIERRSAPADVHTLLDMLQNTIQLPKATKVGAGHLRASNEQLTKANGLGHRYGIYID